ncbi:MAG: terpene cyclase/mutase family protein [Kiritimatiellae bacterium]|nr:terpene cyclase/mutase family protein [Kiritimatiellia bacterium]
MTRHYAACSLVLALGFLSLTAVAAKEPDNVDLAIERGLEYLLAVQKDTGAYPGQYGDTVAIPALAAMACLATGHVPGDAKYGKLIERSLDYVLANHDETGYFGAVGNGKMYAHSIATLLLTEVSGMVSKERQAQIDTVLPKAIKVILDAQDVKKNKQSDGGWRYTPDAKDSDTSCSGWALMALRSARLNGAQVPKSAIERAVKYMHRHHHREKGCFGYQNPEQFAVTLSGAGILCLELCGKHEDPDSLSAAKFLMSVYREKLPNESYAYYGLYYASQGLFQIGGENWKEFSDWMYDTYLPMQRSSGAWPEHGSERTESYATAMTILAFAVPFRQLPVYQRDETVDE